MTTLSQLIHEYSGNGWIIDDAGNGSAGPNWVEWDGDVAEEYGDIEMELVSGDTARELIKIAKNVLSDYSEDDIYVSDWIIDGTGDNPYRYRVIF